MATTTKTKSAGFSDAEKAAAQARVKELKAEAKRGADRAAGEKDLLAAIAAMEPGDRELARQIHEIVSKAAPQLDPKTWYGMPSYSSDGKNVCWFKPSNKFKDRYCTFGFEQAAHLDDGNAWPVAYAITKLTAADEARFAALVKKAAS